MHMCHVVGRSVPTSTLAICTRPLLEETSTMEVVTNVTSAIVNDCVSLSPSVCVQVNICNKISGSNHICLSLYIGDVYTYTHT